jgi:hypothetical protein
MPGWCPLPCQPTPAGPRRRVASTADPTLALRSATKPEFLVIRAMSGCARRFEPDSVGSKAHPAELRTRELLQTTVLNAPETQSCLAVTLRKDRPPTLRAISAPLRHCLAWRAIFSPASRLARRSSSIPSAIRRRTSRPPNSRTQIAFVTETHLHATLRGQRSQRAGRRALLWPKEDGGAEARLRHRYTAPETVTRFPWARELDVRHTPGPPWYRVRRHRRHGHFRLAC